MFSAKSIRELMETGQITWPGALQGDGLLLQLGTPLQPLLDNPPEIDMADQASIDALYAAPMTEWDTYRLEPGQLVMCHVSEPLHLGAGVSGVLGDLSHVARLGLMTHLNSPHINQGSDGYITLELYNAGPAVLKLYRGMPVAKLMLYRIEGADGEPEPNAFYGHTVHLGSRYADAYFSRPSQRPTLR